MPTARPQCAAPPHPLHRPAYRDEEVECVEPVREEGAHPEAKDSEADLRQQSHHNKDGDVENPILLVVGGAAPRRDVSNNLMDCQPHVQSNQ